MARDEAPLPKLEARYPAITASRIEPRWLTGRPNVLRMDGQATPSTPSGRPRLTKAANAMAHDEAARRGGHAEAIIFDRRVLDGHRGGG